MIRGRDVPVGVVDFAPDPVRDGTSAHDPAERSTSVLARQISGWDRDAAHFWPHRIRRARRWRGTMKGCPTAAFKTLVLRQYRLPSHQAIEFIAANPDRFELVGHAAGGGHPAAGTRARSDRGDQPRRRDERAAKGPAASHTTDPTRRLG